ncbi:MAG: alpha/beta hydrolase [Candidatus Poribacteria bacterium]|nr:alpha/beta hydrolase [Candidatus Poribacteria bacterium]
MASATTLTTDWGEMAYSDTGGSGKSLLFLHGTGCDSADWTSVTEKLPQNQRLITFDFRGHGQSSVPTEPFTLTHLANDVLHLVNSIGIQEVILVGHSLGGMVAMEVAKRSSCVAGLVLLEGWTSLSSAGSAFDTGRFYGALSQTERTSIQQKAEKTRNRFKPNVWESFWTSVQDFDAYVYLKQACIPIYEVFGEMGKNKLTEQKLRIPPNPNIKVIWVPNAGHYLPHEYPEAVSDICIKFVETFS